MNGDLPPSPTIPNGRHTEDLVRYGCPALLAVEIVP
jgi:hypothetical protein